MAFETDIFGDCTGLFFCLAKWSNTVTDGYFWSIILIAFGIVLFMGTATVPSIGGRRGFGYSSFATALLGLTLIQLGLIPLWFFTLILVISGIGIAVMFIGEN